MKKIQKIHWILVVAVLFTAFMLFTLVSINKGELLQNQDFVICNFGLQINLDYDPFFQDTKTLISFKKDDEILQLEGYYLKELGDNEYESLISTMITTDFLNTLGLTWETQNLEDIIEKKLQEYEVRIKAI